MQIQYLQILLKTFCIFVAWFHFESNWFTSRRLPCGSVGELRAFWCKWSKLEIRKACPCINKRLEFANGVAQNILWSHIVSVCVTRTCSAKQPVYIFRNLVHMLNTAWLVLSVVWPSSLHPLLVRTRTRSRCWAAILLSHHPEPSGHKEAMHSIGSLRCEIRLRELFVVWSTMMVV